MGEEERIRSYRECVYEKGGIVSEKGKVIDEGIPEKERDKDYRLSATDRLRYRTRYFSDSGIIGTKGFVNQYYREFKSYFNSKREKRPRKIAGFNDIYSMKYLIKDI